MIGKSLEEVPIYIVRVPGLPRKEAIQAYLNELGAELIGVYNIFTGVPQGIDLATDGVEVMFKVQRGRQPQPHAFIDGQPSRVYIGIDLTRSYRQ